jgi:membrane protein DedA with SNARE-associated domain
MQLLIDLLAFLEPYGTHSYIVMFGILLACGFGLPMPEDVVLITGGILASHGVTQLWLVNIVCMAGVLIGDSTIFWIGRTLGNQVKTKGVFKKVFTESRDATVRKVFDRYGNKVIFMARFMPGLRTPIFMTAGTYHVGFLKFIALDGLAALLSVPMWVYIGFVFGKNLEELEVKIRQFKFGIYSILALLVIIFVSYAFIKRRASTTTTTTTTSTSTSASVRHAGQLQKEPSRPSHSQTCPRTERCHCPRRLNLSAAPTEGRLVALCRTPTPCKDMS